MQDKRAPKTRRCSIKSEKMKLKNSRQPNDTKKDAKEKNAPLSSTHTPHTISQILISTSTPAGMSHAISLSTVSEVTPLTSSRREWVSC